MNNRLILFPLILLFFFFAFLVPNDLRGQSLSESITFKINELFAKWDNSNGPGCVTGIVQGNHLVYAKGFGLANLENKVPNTPATAFYMCSVSKQFTGYAIALLVNEGKIKLNEDIRAYLPWMDDFNGNKITVQNLVNHTSGLRDDINLAPFYGLAADGILTQELAMRMLKQQRTLNFNPGEKFSYSNSNYVLLAEIVHAVTGKSFKTYTDSVIFKPLGMTASSFADDHSELILNRANSYEKHQNTFYNALQNVYTLGDGGLFTNVYDMAKWVTNFYEPKAGTLEDIKLMLSPGKLKDGTIIPYAMGINVDVDRGHKRLIHNGGLAGYRTIIAVYPELKTGFFVFGNAGDADVYNKVNQIAELLIPDQSGNKPAQVTSQQAENRLVQVKDSTELIKWAGSYIAANGYKVVVAYKAGRLFVNNNLELTEEGRNSFHLLTRASVKYQFSADPKTSIFKTVLISPVLSKPIEMERVQEVMLSEAAINEYVGQYVSEESGAIFTIGKKDNELWISDKYHDPSKITFWGPEHLFTSYDFLNHIRIIRNSKHTISGFELNSGDTANMMFIKRK